MTAGVAQNFINLSGLRPANRCVILGSGDIGLIMARRLKLEGADVVGVYEAKPEPSGLTRNLYQCLYDFNIPLYLNKTVTRVFGQDRLEAVEISSTDEKMNPVKGTEEIIECDSLIISVGLIPENETAEKLGITIDKRTKGPIVDQFMETSVRGVYSVGNALHVHDLVDYVSEGAEIAGDRIADGFLGAERELAEVSSEGLLYVVPQRIDIKHTPSDVIFYMRSAKEIRSAVLTVTAGGDEIFKKRFVCVRPPEAERVELRLPDMRGKDLVFKMEGKEE
jgi:NAD(P)H-nitrite reductase